MNPLSDAIRGAVAAPAKALLRAYFEPEGPFAGATFDLLSNNDSARYTAEDIVAASLLDVRFTPQAVRGLLDPEGEPGEALSRIDSDVDLWAPEAGTALEAAGAARATLVALPGVGPTRASRLLARKRPRLIPIVDSVIRAALPLGSNSWESLRVALVAPDLREQIEAARPANAPVDITLPRLLDVAVWMRHSQLTNARVVRTRVMGDAAS